MWGDLIGHERAIVGLRHALARAQVRHAYLVTGPDQVGKRTLALAFAQAIQCARRAPGQDDACGVCDNCRKIAHGTHPDTLVLALPLDEHHKPKANYGIGQVREVIANLALRPTEGRRRIYLIPNAELFLLPGMQAMLKTLEEPPSTSMILLTAVSADLLLPTIRSRCQEVALSPVPAATLAERLQGRVGGDADRARAVADLAGGLPGWAIQAIEQPELLAARHQTLRALAALTRASRAERIAAAGVYAPDRETARRTLALWLPWWRDVALAAHGAPDIIRHRADRDLIASQARLAGPQGAERFVRALATALRELDQNANPRLTLDVLLQSLPGLEDDARRR